MWETNAHKNKHKFVQKVAKKNNLLVSFKSSINIGIHNIKQGFTRLDKVKRY